MIAQQWKLGLALVSVYVVVVLAIFFQTAFSMFETWGRMQTYNHGYLIVPITLWLIWDRRHSLRHLLPRVSPLALPALIGSGAIWYLGALTDALVVQQLALVAMLVTGVWAILGIQLVWALLFPLAFLFFAVPVGDDLVPPLMEFTATFTVELLRLTGIPVYREGLYFSLPTGDWSVVQACSGIRYLIASVTLGCLFANLTYTSTLKRTLFVLASIVVPIFANGLRAYSIVIIGHLSGMKLATGVDHLLWGWFFFGIVMFILFSVGAIWREKESADSENDAEAANAAPAEPSRAGLISGTFVAVVVVSFWFVMAGSLDARQPPEFDPDIHLPDRLGSWQASAATPWEWLPKDGGADRQALQFYEGEGTTVQLVLQQYLSQVQGEELVQTGEFLLGKNAENWRVKGRSKVPITLGDSQITARRAVLEGQFGERVVVLSWYRVDEHYTSHAYMVKAREALSYARFQVPVSSRVYLLFRELPSDSRTGPAQAFLDASLESIEQSLDALQ